MFDFDVFREILSTIRKNKLRTVLTGFAVAWGIFMLIVLLACGNGLKNGFISNFSDRAQNSISIYPGWTSKPYKGMPSDRQIKFDDKDYNLIRNKLPNVEYVTARIGQTVTLSYGEEYGSYGLNGVSPDGQYIFNLKIIKGRFINAIDMSDHRKVMVISEDIEQVLFKGEDPIGKIVIANNIAYHVIGLYAKNNQYDNSPPAYIPFTTAQMLYNKGWGFNQLVFTVNGLNTVQANEAYIENLRNLMGKLHSFDPQDLSAFYVRNMAERVEQTKDTMDTINLFVMVVGICSLMAGAVGVGNIMVITVKERTREIGIRKALGATPASVLRLIIFESVFVTTLFGYVGMVMGIAVSELINVISEMASSQGGSGEGTIFKNPTVEISTIVWAMLFLIVIGAVAGLIPALKAVRVKPIEAMRDE